MTALRGLQARFDERARLWVEECDAAGSWVAPSLDALFERYDSPELRRAIATCTDGDDYCWICHQLEVRFAAEEREREFAAQAWRRNVEQRASELEELRRLIPARFRPFTRAIELKEVVPVAALAAEAHQCHAPPRSTA